MAAVSGTTRKYDSSRRRQQAHATKTRILEAAQELFTERGYAGTTLAAIAERADVALPTVYAAASSKRAILAELVQGTGEAEGWTWFPAVGDKTLIRDAADPRAILDLLAARAAEDLRAGYALLAAMRAAAGLEEEAAELERRVQQRRLGGWCELLDRLAADGKLAAGVPPRRVAETLWSLTDFQVFHLLVEEQGWSPEEFGDWLATMASAYLRAPAGE